MVFRERIAILALLCALIVPCAAVGGQAGSPGIKEGDLVSVNFTATTGKGEVVRTTFEKSAKDPALRKSQYYEACAVFAPEDVIAGRAGGSIPGLSEALIGMRAGEKKRVVLKPDAANVSVDPAKRKEMPCVRNMPKTIRMSPQEYVGAFHSFPIVGKEVPITPYFKAVVAEVSEQSAVLDCQIKDGDRFEDSFGTVEIKIDQQNVSMVLSPRLGSNFPMEGGQLGKIVSSDGIKFIVDANNPLAGIPLTVDLEIASVTGAARLDSLQIKWVEDYDKGIALAREQKKPAVIVLYADWCGFCKRFFTQTIQDPRIKTFSDRFVWIKVNSDTQKKYYEMYEQKGFPLIVILNRDGQPMDRMDGFKDASAFHDELAKTSKAL